MIPIVRNSLQTKHSRYQSFGREKCPYDLTPGTPLAKSGNPTTEVPQMRTTIILLSATLLLCGALGPDAPAAPGSMNSCTAAIIGHASAAHSWTQCEAATPGECEIESILADLAMRQVFFWCHGIML